MVRKILRLCSSKTKGNPKENKSVLCLYSPQSVPLTLDGVSKKETESWWSSPCPQGSSEAFEWLTSLTPEGLRVKNNFQGFQSPCDHRRGFRVLPSALGLQGSNAFIACHPPPSSTSSLGRCTLGGFWKQIEPSFGTFQMNPHLEPSRWQNVH